MIIAIRCTINSIVMQRFQIISTRQPQENEQNVLTLQRKPNSILWMWVWKVDHYASPKVRLLCSHNYAIWRQIRNHTKPVLWHLPEITCNHRLPSYRPITWPYSCKTTTYIGPVIPQSTIKQYCSFLPSSLSEYKHSAVTAGHVTQSDRTACV